MYPLILRGKTRLCLLSMLIKPSGVHSLLVALAARTDILVDQLSLGLVLILFVAT